MNTYRPSIENMPHRIAALPISDNGYPIPYFVAKIDGKHDFRVIDPLKIHRCVRDKLCWICGDKLGKFKAFSAGPLLTVTRLSGEPPSHTDCAEFAARTCPFMLLPRSKMHTAEIDGTTAIPAMLTHNPGVTVIWVTDSYEVIRGGHSVAFLAGEPISVHWYAEGQHATRDHAERGIALSLMHAVETSKGNPDTQRMLMESAADIDAYLPLE